MMKYASVTYVKTLRVNNFILEGELCTSVRKALLIPDSTVPWVSYKYAEIHSAREERGIGGGTQGTRDIDLFWEQLIGSPTKNTIIVGSIIRKINKLSLLTESTYPGRGKISAKPLRTTRN